MKGSEVTTLLLSGGNLDYAGESCDSVLCWCEKSNNLTCYFEFMR